MEQETADNIVAVLKQAIKEQGASTGKSIEELKSSIDFLEEDVRMKVIDVCQNVAPGYKEKFMEVIDSVHRLGKKHLAKVHARDVILQFSMRHFRDMIWKISKHSEYLKLRNLRFKEDLIPEDREKRNRLWPLIQQARQEKKITFFVGGRAFVDNKEIF